MLVCEPNLRMAFGPTNAAGWLANQLEVRAHVADGQYPSQVGTCQMDVGRTTKAMKWNRCASS